MTKKELKERLVKEGMPKDAYWLDEDAVSMGEELCLLKNENLWEVYYSERGLKSNLKIFEKEEEACENFYNRIIKMCS